LFLQGYDKSGKVKKPAEIKSRQALEVDCVEQVGLFDSFDGKFAAVSALENSVY